MIIEILIFLKIKMSIRDKKILITGTGRCGTTFLMRIFILLELNTGFHKETYKKSVYENCNSGLEKHSLSKSIDIFKDPEFIQSLPNELSIIPMIGVVIIPLRDFNDAAESRANLGMNATGGLWNAKDKKSQIEYYHRIISEYTIFMSKYDIPTLFLDFERMVNEPEYLYVKLKNYASYLLKNISYGCFIVAYELASVESKRSVS